MKNFSFVLCLLFVAAINLPAQNSRKNEVVSCDVAAFVHDTTSGVNIRDGAGEMNKIKKTIPAHAGGTLVFINGSKDKWVRISSAVNSQKTKIFSGTGWIYAPLLAVNLIDRNDEPVRFYGKPSTTPASNNGIRPAFNPFLMLGCSGDWLKLSVPVRGSETGEEGWFKRGSYCGTPWGDCM